MSEKLFFDDSADSLVKDWLKGATAVEDTAKVAVKPLDAGNKKHGLGYEDKKPKLDSKDALLATRIRNQKKRKADEDAVEIHGLVEDEETSRTTITTKKQHPHVTQKQKKTVSNKAVTHTEKPLKSNPSPDDTLAVLSPLKRPEPDRTTDSTQPNTEKMKRKRPKTRSKQKNIRHDHRREDQKPEHLRIGSSTYTGRPLTEETKVILTQMKEPAAVDNKPMSKSQLKKQKKNKNRNSTEQVEELGWVIDKGNSSSALY